MNNSDRQKLYFGDWKLDPPKPSPEPWKFRPFKVTYGPSRGETEYVIHDAEGKYVATCDRREDADHIVSLEERLHYSHEEVEALKMHLRSATRSLGVWKKRAKSFLRQRNELRTRYRFFEWIRKLFS